MAQPDFNGSFEGFKETSKAYAAAVKALRSDDSYKDSGARPERRRAIDACFEVVFESIVIFGTIAPAQARMILRESPAAQLHDFHSAASRQALKAASKGLTPIVLQHGCALAHLVITRPSIAKMLGAEVSERLASAEKSDAPPRIKRRALRP